MQHVYHHYFHKKTTVCRDTKAGGLVWRASCTHGNTQEENKGTKLHANPVNCYLGRLLLHTQITCYRAAHCHSVALIDHPSWDRFCCARRWGIESFVPSKFRSYTVYPPLQLFRSACIRILACSLNHWQAKGRQSWCFPIIENPDTFFLSLSSSNFPTTTPNKEIILDRICDLSYSVAHALRDETPDVNNQLWPLDYNIYNITITKIIWRLQTLSHPTPDVWWTLSA